MDYAPRVADSVHVGNQSFRVISEETLNHIVDILVDRHDGPCEYLQNMQLSCHIIPPSSKDELHSFTPDASMVPVDAGAKARKWQDYDYQECDDVPHREDDDNL